MAKGACEPAFSSAGRPCDMQVMARTNPVAADERHDLLEVIEDRHGSHSTIITSQLPISSWHDYLNDPTVADALLDRLLANAHRLELKGESLRKTRQKLTHREHSK